MIDTPLGKNVHYSDQYDSSLLVGIPRLLAREAFNLGEELPFNGVDIWNYYEVSWLNQNGKPCVKIVQLIVPADSENIIESKSLKLYLNSFYGTKFSDENQVKQLIQKDCSAVLKKDIEVRMYDLSSFEGQPLRLFKGQNIDDVDIEFTEYKVNPALLKISEDKIVVEEILNSNLLKSNCLVTNQPDWASVQISYRGRKINHESLLRYIVSFRCHNGFHEQCVERIFLDIMHYCTPEQLTVHAKYTRRGGIDINPYRTNSVLDVDAIDLARDVRQ
jgi:7-cyano-7-deazaguanine reductase